MTLPVPLVCEAAVFLYGSSARSPQELCEALGGTLGCPGTGASGVAPAKPDTSDEALITSGPAPSEDDEDEHPVLVHTPATR